MISNNNAKNDISILQGKIVGVKHPEKNIPLYGKLIGVNNQFITLERKDGSITIVNTDFIEYLWPTRNQPVASPRGGC